MGRKTYEFGCKFGLQPEQPAYPHMLHFIFSDSFTLENADSTVQIKKINLNEIELIQKQRGSDIYLNPLILGQGIKLFGASKQTYKTKLIETELFENGLLFYTYKINY